MSALDIPEMQVAVDFDDPNFPWHWRCLVARLGETSDWVCFTSDLDCEVISLASHVVVVLVRGAPFPKKVRNKIYHPGALDQADIDNAIRECFQLRDLLVAPKVEAAAQSVADYRFSDTSFERFSEIVPHSAVRDTANFVSRGAVALVQVTDDDGEALWTTADRVLPKDFETWLDEKRHGPGRDPRVLALKRDTRDVRFRSLREVVSDFSFDEAKDRAADWPFGGPSATRELLLAIRASGEEITGFHDYWVRSTGIAPGHSVALKHRDFLSVLAHLVTFDQLNPGKLAGCEATSRHILQIHSAVRKNNKQPDFKGTQLMVMSTLDANGGILSGEFAKWTAEEQKAYAFTLKQQRLYAEEEDAQDKRQGRASNQKNADKG